MLPLRKQEISLNELSSTAPNDVQIIVYDGRYNLATSTKLINIKEIMLNGPLGRTV